MKKMRHMKRKALVALVLSVTMLLTLMPGLVFGVSDDQGDPDTVSSSIDYPTVNFTDVAPFLPPVSGTALRRSPARDAGDTDPSSDNGMVVNKTSVYNEETGAYDITLEAYATGSKVISTVTSDVPTDIVLVLDQSGSMGDNFSTTTSDSWVSYGKRTNDANYNNRMDSSNKSKNRNLYYKLSDGGYAEVRMDRSEAGTVKKYTEYSGNNYSCNHSSDTLYTEVNGQYVKVSVSSEYDYTSAVYIYTYTYTAPDNSPVTETSRGPFGDPPFPIYKEETVTEYAYTYSYTVNGTRTDIGTSTGADTVFETELYQKIPSGTKITRLEALKNAAATFANSVEEKAKGADGVLGTEDDISHRIAVVGFASKSDYGDNTELLSIAGSNSGSVGVAYHNITDQNLKDVLQNVDTSAGQAMVSTAIDALAASGATRTDLGLDMAQRILSANPVQPNEKRNRVVIVFTDGAPTSFNGFEKDVANDAITHAGAIKTAGATVYTIGIFSGANATSAGTEPKGDLGQNSSSLNSACNWFMQQVSSNNGTPRTPSYYLSAADTGSLSNIFQQISDNIESGGSSSTLTEESVVRDIISPQFTLPAGATASDITLETYACTGKVNVFKPTLTYEDGTVYYGDTFDRATLPGYRTSTSWFHNGTDAATVTMTGIAPALSYGYTYDTTLLTDTVDTKQDIPVKATISIGDTNITADTTFLHTDCAGETWSHTSGDPAFLLHVRTCALTVTKTGGADGEPYVFNVYRNGNPYTQVTVVGNSSITIYELPVGKYTIAEDTGWSWRYDAAYDPDKPDGCTLTAGHNSGSITCTNTLKNDRWLNGFSDVIANIFGIRH